MGASLASMRCTSSWAWVRAFCSAFLSRASRAMKYVAVLMATKMTPTAESTRAESRKAMPRPVWTAPVLLPFVFAVEFVKAFIGVFIGSFVGAFAVVFVGAFIGAAP
ncbi:MAG: hypothetical protein A2051_06660 [Desulfovibrionales bacterium GWA2_65_9]|nr:MAG: hypothetical protein A2051_06660 [Desulfovibrionales bacterium GWA2_65_9]